MDTEQMERVIATYMNNYYFRDLVENPELYKAARTFWENTYKYFYKVFEGDFYTIDGAEWLARDSFFEERLVQYTNLMHHKLEVSYA